MPHRLSLATLAALVALAVSACGGTDDEAPREVVLVTHDSFACRSPPSARSSWSGFTLRILKTGDAGAALNRALLTAGNPEGDVFFGADNNLLSRALEGGGAVRAVRVAAARAGRRAVVLDDEHRLTPVDHGEVCLNTDRAYFEREQVTPPRRLADLTSERYRNLLVVENPATSSPGLAFLLATVAEFGDRWPDFWLTCARRRARRRRLGGGVHAALLGRRRRQGRPADRRLLRLEPDRRGRLRRRGARARPDRGRRRELLPPGRARGCPARRAERGRGAGADRLRRTFLTAFQRDVPLSMFVFPVRKGIALPPVFTEHALEVDQPLELPPEEIGANRDRWIGEWTDIVLR